MKKVYILAFCLFPVSFTYNQAQEGFFAGTKIKTPYGYTSIENLKEHDVVIGYDLNGNYQEYCILRCSKKQILNCVKIAVDNEIIYAAPNQKFRLLEDNIWINAQDITLSHYLFSNLSEFISINHIEKIYRPTEVHTITVEGHNFCIAPYDICVHNTDTYACTQAMLIIGSINVFNPIVVILGTAVALTAISLATHKKYNSHNINIDNKAQTNTPSCLPERIYYEKRRHDLYQLHTDFLKIKENLQTITKCCHPYAMDFTCLFLQSIKSSGILNSPFKTTAKQELQFNDLQRNNLQKLRQTELDHLEQLIIDLQITLAFHFYKLIERRNQAVQHIAKNHWPMTSKLIQEWNKNNITGISPNIVLIHYENKCMTDDILQDLDNKNQELKLAIEYYKNPNHASVIKKTTNITDLFVPEQENIKKIEHFVLEQKKLNANNKKIIEEYCVNHRINIANLKNKIRDKINKQRKSQISKELVEAEKIRASIKPPEDPKKDDEDDKKKSKIQISESDVHHIFRNKTGHLPDTSANRKLLIETASNIKNFLGPDKFGNKWYGKILSNGKQVWVLVRNNLIRNGGLNETPKVFNNQTGLCQLGKCGK